MSILVYGNRLEVVAKKQLSSNSKDLKRVSVYVQPDLPSDNAAQTAFVDLETETFSQGEFLSRLKSSSDKLKIIGVVDDFGDDRSLEMARKGISEVLSEEEYRIRLLELLEPEKGQVMSSPSTSGRLDLTAIIGDSDRMVAIKKMIDHLCDADYPNAIIFGETGTGKGLVAKVMHYTGVRRDSNFIEVNCSAIPDELFESELFGHKKGAFTDAKTDKTGLFEFAHNGTIFLDEAGNLSPSAQAKLLNILENRKLRPLGAVESTEINVRVLAATNIDLDSAVNNGTFREDLLYRLNLIAVHLPPLRERKEDIPDLIDGALRFYKNLYNKPELYVDEKVVNRLVQHNWPGNVRELRNVVERAVLLATRDRITIRQIGEAIDNGRISARERKLITIEIPEQGIALREIERRVVGEILNMVNWNRSEAARRLGISRARLRRIMEDNNLQKDRRKNQRGGTR